MSGDGLPSGTPAQLEVFDAIARREVKGYPGFARPQMFWRPSMLDEHEVTPRATRLLDAGLVEWEQSWFDVADRTARYLLEPTGDGAAWRERAAERERRAAERQARRAEAGGTDA